MLNKNKKITKTLIGIFVIANIFLPFNNSHSENISDLKGMISDKQKIISELNNQQKVYQQKIKQKQQESASLSNEISILNSKIASRTLGIESTNLQVENMNLEIKSVNLEIERKENEIEINKERIKNSLQNLYREEEKGGYLKVLLLYDNLSDFFDEINKFKSIQSDLKKKTDSLNQLKEWLEQKNSSLVKSKAELESLYKKLTIDQYKLKEEQDVKFMFLARTEHDEAQFYNLLAELRAEQEEANNLITQYENQARRLLAEQSGRIPDDDGVLIWPVPSKHVTAYFHDPDYPFRRIFEHPAIDIRAGQGTPLKAAGSGYVAVAKDNGYGYSYIMLVHNNGLSTVYGHVSQMNVSPGDFVLQGDIIGKSGGMPGTKGAGRLTTAPHLHFEVRINGTPTNPLNYLGN
jgi:murein DD-endopeptidase MepM/ murein hydrolase activator NlpD